jgi:hypothetical protein
LGWSVLFLGCSSPLRSTGVVVFVFRFITGAGVPEAEFVFGANFGKSADFFSLLLSTKIYV